MKQKMHVFNFDDLWMGNSFNLCFINFSLTHSFIIENLRKKISQIEIELCCIYKLMSTFNSSFIGKFIYKITIYNGPTHVSWYINFISLVWTHNIEIFRFVERDEIDMIYPLETDDFQMIEKSKIEWILYISANKFIK